MPRKIFAKIVHAGYLGQVLTAGLLLTIAALLMFAVISTLEPVAKPPAAKTAPVSEAVQPDQTAASNSLLTDPVVTIQPSTASPSVTASEEAVADDSRTVTNSQAIRALWSGIITQKFGWQLHPLYQDWRYHNGVDIAGEEGQIVPALVSGKVIDIYTDKQYGLTVVVKSDRYLISYSSLASAAVQENTIINLGRPIGSMGITLSEPEPHLHLAVQTPDKEQYLDPYEVFSQHSGVNSFQQS